MPKIKEFVDYLNEIRIKENYKILCFFITDIFENTSYVLYNTNSKEIIKDSFKLNEIYEGIALKNIISRKIQILPNIIETMEK